jgi:mannose-1-phosphate guanylyltransferase
MAVSKVVLIMAGGSGKRFWPQSTSDNPKQFLKFFLKKSLIQDTLDRFLNYSDRKNVFICAAQDQKNIFSKHLPHFKNMIFEPEARNTAACLMLSARELLKKYDPNTVVVVTPADHYVGNQKKFLKLIEQSSNFASKNEAIITLGIKPTSPHTGYGYIEKSKKVEKNIFEVSRFKEKPDFKTAQKYLKTKKYLWNGGIFVFSLKTIQKAFEKHLQKEWQQLNKAKSFVQTKKVYQKLPKLPFDIAIIEKSKNVYTIPLDADWSDLGSWDMVYELARKDHNKNVLLSGSLRALDSKNCLISTESLKEVSLLDVNDLLVVESKGVLLVALKASHQRVKELAV